MSPAQTSVGRAPGTFGHTFVYQITTAWDENYSINTLIKVCLFRQATMSFRHCCHPLSKLHKHSSISYISFARQAPSKSVSPTGVMLCTEVDIPWILLKMVFTLKSLHLETIAHVKDTLLPFPKFKKWAPFQSWANKKYPFFFLIKNLGNAVNVL